MIANQITELFGISENICKVNHDENYEHYRVIASNYGNVFMLRTGNGKVDFYKKKNDKVFKVLEITDKDQSFIDDKYNFTVVAVIKDKYVILKFEKSNELFLIKQGEPIPKDWDESILRSTRKLPSNDNLWFPKDNSFDLDESMEKLDQVSLYINKILENKN